MTDTLDADQDYGAPPAHGLNAGKHYGPFTLPVWGLIIGGGAIAGLAIRHFQGTSSATSTNTADTALDAQTNPANYGYTATGGPFAGGGTGSTTPSAGGTIAASTNVQWEQIALEELIAQGTDPALANQALGNYLDGLPVTPQQKSIISLALRLEGSPPEGAPVLQDVPTTPAAPVDGGNPQNPTPTPVPNPAQPVTAPGGAPLAPVQQQWVGDVLTTIGLLNQGGAVAQQNFSKAQFLGISSHDPNLLPWVSIAYYGWLKQQGDPNHLT